MKDWFQVGKGIHQGCILSPCLFNLYVAYIMRNAGWIKHKLESRLPGEIAITLDMQRTPSLWQKLKRNKEPLDESWRREWKSWLKTQHSKKTKIMASGPITSWQIDGKTMQMVTDFIFVGSKITADGDWSHEIKRHLFLGRKAVRNLDSILKSRDVTLLTKVCLVKAMVFPAVMYGCESWTMKKAKPWRIDAFELWCWRRLLRVPWTAGRFNQSILKEINPGCSLEGLMLKLKLNTSAMWCEELTHWKRPWCWEGLGAGGEGDDRGWDGWMASPTQWTWVWVDSGSWWWTRKPGVLPSMGSQRVRHDWATELTSMDIHRHNTIINTSFGGMCMKFRDMRKAGWSQGRALA